MALTNNGTKVSIHPSGLPSGYSVPSVTTFADHESKRSVVISIVKSTVENADPATTLTALVVAVNAAAAVLITDDLDVTRTVTMFADLKVVRTNLVFSADLYKNVVPSYICTVDIFYKAAA